MAASPAQMRCNDRRCGNHGMMHATCIVTQLTWSPASAHVTTLQDDAYAPEGKVQARKRPAGQRRMPYSKAASAANRRGQVTEVARPRHYHASAVTAACTRASFATAVLRNFAGRHPAWQPFRTLTRLHCKQGAQDWGLGAAEIPAAARRKEESLLWLARTALATTSHPPALPCRDAERATIKRFVEDAIMSGEQHVWRP